MGQILIRNLPDDVVSRFKTRAELAGKSLEREMIVANAPYTAEECLAISDALLAKQTDLVLPLSKDEICEGLL